MGSSFHSTKGFHFDNLISTSPFYSDVAIIGAHPWVRVASLTQKTLRTETQVCDVDSVERRLNVEKEQLCLVFKDLN